MRNSGKAYVSRSKSKKQFSARKIRSPCGEKCRLGCSKKISDTEREKIFTKYWELANLQMRREFILRHIEVIIPKYRYSSTQNFRNMNSAFYFQVNDKSMQTIF